MKIIKISFLYVIYYIPFNKLNKITTFCCFEIRTLRTTILKETFNSEQIVYGGNFTVECYVYVLNALSATIYHSSYQTVEAYGREKEPIATHSQLKMLSFYNFFCLTPAPTNSGIFVPKALLKSESRISLFNPDKCFKVYNLWSRKEVRIQLIK